MHHLTKVKLIQKLNEEELRRNVPQNASWHTKYKDSAYIYIGGFPYELTEGDIAIVFSQYGEVVDCKLVRDRETGKSKGFGFLCYEDQKSTILAVDNLNGANISDRVIRVDHVEQFKIPREYFEVDNSAVNINNISEEERKFYKPSGPDGKGWGEDRILSPEEEKYFEELKVKEMNRENQNNIVNNSNYIMDENEKWEMEFSKMIKENKELEDKEKEEKVLKKKKKKEKKIKKEKKKLKKLKKEEKKKQLVEQELKEVYASYGVNVNK